MPSKSSGRSARAVFRFLGCTIILCKCTVREQQIEKRFYRQLKKRQRFKKQKHFEQKWSVQVCKAAMRGAAIVQPGRGRRAVLLPAGLLRAMLLRAAVPRARHPHGVKIKRAHAHGS